jgi:hypothetical protein
MMTSDRLPMAWICVTTRPKRRSAGRQRAQQVDEEDRRAAPAAQQGRSARAQLRQPVHGGCTPHAEVVGDVGRRVVELDRAVGLAAHELPHLGVGGGHQLGRRALRHDAPAGGQQHHPVADGHALGHVVRDHQRGGAGHVVERADQLGGHAHADEVQPGEGLVVHDELGVQRDGTRQRDAARHAARDFADLQRRRAAQAHGVELHQHDVADHAPGRSVISRSGKATLS